MILAPYWGCSTKAWESTVVLWTFWNSVRTQVHLLFGDVSQITSGMLCMTPQSRDRESFGMILHRMRLISQIAVRKKLENQKHQLIGKHIYQTSISWQKYYLWLCFYRQEYMLRGGTWFLMQLWYPLFFWVKCLPHSAVFPCLCL